MESYDIIIVGGGPAGSSCASFCAQAGLKTLVLERSFFPRNKVCGDTINPNCWPILKELGLEQPLRSLTHSKLKTFDLVTLDKEIFRSRLESRELSSIAIKRSAFDLLLLNRAVEMGADVVQASAVTRIEGNWQVETSTGGCYRSKYLVAADGRNSSVCRLLRILPKSKRDRIGMHTHCSAPAEIKQKVILQLLEEGYCGIANVGQHMMNVCLVSKPAAMKNQKLWASEEYRIPRNAAWQSITPIHRQPLSPVQPDNLLLVGDSARVVEPFTGEGIYYALASGKLAAESIARKEMDSDHGAFKQYKKDHRNLYRGRLWINRLSRHAVLNTRLSSNLIKWAGVQPWILQRMVKKVMKG